MTSWMFVLFVLFAQIHIFVIMYGVALNEQYLELNMQIDSSSKPSWVDIISTQVSGKTDILI